MKLNATTPTDWPFFPQMDVPDSVYLPGELWLEICKAIADTRARASCRLVCAAWRHHLDTAAAWADVVARDGSGCALRRACSKGRLAAAQWLAQTFGLPFGLTDEDARVLRMACVHGHLPTAQWLTTRFTLNVKVLEIFDARLTLYYVCARGHLATAQWLVVTFGLTAKDARADDNWALRRACEKGHLPIAQWLVTTFDLTVEDVKSQNNYALRKACEGGHLSTAQWLVEAFGLTETDVLTPTEPHMERDECHQAVIEWMRDREQ